MGVRRSQQMPITHLCPPFPIVSEGFKGGTRGAPIVPRDAVSQTAHVGTVGTNGLTTCSAIATGQFTTVSPWGNLSRLKLKTKYRVSLPQTSLPEYREHRLLALIRLPDPSEPQYQIIENVINSVFLYPQNTIWKVFTRSMEPH